MISCDVPKNQDKPYLNKGYAFVEFDTEAQAKEAMSKIHGMTFRNRNLAANVSERDLTL